MNYNSLQTEKLIRYIDGELNTTEVAELQNELSGNNDMQEELDSLLLAKKVINNHGLSQQIASIHQKMMTELSTNKTKQTAVVKSLPKKIMKLAAGIILLAGLFAFYQYFTLSASSMYNKQYSEYSINTFRGTEMVAPLEKAYSEKKYEEVITLFNKLPNTSIKEIFLAGQAYLQKENYKAAIQSFTNIIEKNKGTNSSILNDDATYYLALAHLKNEDISSAKKIFQSIYENKNHLYNSKVSSWFLKKLQMLEWKY